MGTIKDERINYLEEERQKLWAQVTSLQEKSCGLQEETRILREQSIILEEALSKKTSDYEAEAKQAARKTVEYRNKSETAKETATQNLIKINEILNEISSTHESINSLNLQVTEIVSTARSANNDVLAAHDSIKEKQEHIEGSIAELEKLFANSSNYADNIKALQVLANNGQDTATKIDSLHKYLLSKKTEIEELYYEVIGYTEKNEDGVETQVPGLKDELEEAYNELKSNLAKTQDELSEHKSKQISDSISFANQKEAEFNNTLKRWEKEYSRLTEQVSDLLPNALTKGLSHAYSEKKREEVDDTKKLTRKFVGGIIGMICVSIMPFLVSVYFINVENKTLEESIRIIPRLVVAILPLYVPVLWLAYSANKGLNLSKRLIEEYTHKEVLSKTFEGLSRQIENIKDKEMSAELRIKLLYSILEVNSENPGKLITDYNKSDHPLMDALDKSVKLSKTIDKIAEIPGMAKIATILEKKSKRILEEKRKQAVAGLEAVYGGEKVDQDKEDRAAGQA